MTAEVLGISVIGTASSHGTLEAIGKCRGDKKLLVKLQALLTMQDMKAEN